MSKGKKIGLTLVVLAIVGAVIAGSVARASGKKVEVQTGKVGKKDLVSKVSASGEIRPKKFVNVSSDVAGRIVRLLIKEGGENIISWRGYSFSISRIARANGNIVKVLSDAGTGGGNGAAWDDSLYVDPKLYVPAINPDLP